MFSGVKDEELLKRASRGDEAAFLLLYKRYRDPIFRFACRMVGSVELAEDIAHDCFLGLIYQPERFDPGRASLRTYLYAAARNLSIKYFRRLGTEITLEDMSEDYDLLEVQEPLKKILDKELAVEMGKAIAELPHLQREALILFEYEGLSLAEAAEITGTDVGTIKARLFRARGRLRKLFAHYFKSDLKDACYKEIVN
jgi:RNA polymerase sigma-70 factor, ECF subfamily